MHVLSFPSTYLACAIGLAVWLSARAPAASQPLRGHDVTADRIRVDLPEHWRQWTRPEHLLDITPDGRVQPHSFRGTYELIAADRHTYRRPVEPPSIRAADRAIGNLVREPVLDDDGLSRTDEERIGSYLDEDVGRFPGNETLVVREGDFFAVEDTAREDGVITLSLRNLTSGRRSTLDVDERDRLEVPQYDYYLRPGISRAGSKLGDAPNLLDGDPTTWWEPDLSDTSANWWVEVDLGRAVVVERIVLDFVDPDLGEPFRQFRVLASPGQALLEDEAGKLGFSVIGGTRAPSQVRTFEIDADEPRFRQPRSGPDWTGRLIETIRILVTDSKRFRHRLLSEAEWNALPPEERGDIVYHLVDESGFEEPVDRTTYEGVVPERRGRRDFFQRERPRLADIQVWGQGDNLAPGVLGAGGDVTISGPYQASPAFDEDWTTTFTMLTWYPTIPRGEMVVDLGGLVRLEGMRLSIGDGQLDGYIMSASDGARDARGELVWQRISPPEREENRIDLFMYFADLFHPPLRARYLNARVVTKTAGGPKNRPFNSEPRIAELQLYSQGPPVSAAMNSDLIELPGARNFGKLRWDPPPEELPPGTAVEIRTRTGDQLIQTIRYLDVNGNEKTKEQWEKLFSSFRGPVDTTFTPGSGWSPWSRKYVRPGESVTSSGMRRYAQIEVRFTSEQSDRVPWIRSLEIERLDPVAHSVVAEVWPQQAEPGVEDTFAIYLQSTFIEEPPGFATPGFDEILLTTAGPKLRFLEIAAGTEDDLGRQAPSWFFSPDAAAQQGLQIVRDSGDSLWLHLPSRMGVPEGEVPRIYTRVFPAGGEVPVGYDGQPLIAATYALLPEKERGAVRYFRRSSRGGDEVVLIEVPDLQAYEALEVDERGPVRYFRRLTGLGASHPFNARGDSLTEAQYRALPEAERGIAVGEGILVRLRFATAVFRNGTTLGAFVRNSGQVGGQLTEWQRVEPGNATALTEGAGLTIGVPVRRPILADVTLAPNPFTPNGDGINDRLEVEVTVLHITAPRTVHLRLYTLDGQLVREDSRPLEGGRHVFHWDGTDRGSRRVPPGLYICQVHATTDADIRGVTASRLVAVAY